jgi:hypothetical protein
MPRTKDKPYVVTFQCPFCSATIVETYDHSLIPDDISAQEREKIMSGSIDIRGGSCEHLAFESGWIYTGSSIYDKWESQLIEIVKAISEELDEDLAPHDIAEILADAINLSALALEAISKEVLPEYKIVVSSQYVEKFARPSEAGPTYMHIFIKKIISGNTPFF